MGIKKEEEYFPRGRSSATKPALRKAKDKLFKKYKKSKKKSTRKNVCKEDKQEKGNSTKITSSVKEYNITKHVIRPLTYQTLEEGMVVVGRVREVWPYHMFVCLPGRLSAKIPAAAISAPYTESLARLRELEITQQECPSLSELFRVGQLVVCSVVEVKKEEGLLAVSTSLEPSLVNKERSHHSLRAGHVITAAVHSVEDHGYTLHTGITGLTAFLRRGNTLSYVEQHNHGRSLVVGEVLRCLVTKCTTARSASRIEVTLDPDSLTQAVSVATSQTLHPSVTVHCTVEQALSNGLVVAVGQGKAYIEVSQLTKCWSSPKYYKPKSQLIASVLYVLPHTDFQMSSKPVYLTLKDINEDVTPKMTLGEAIQAKVINSGPRGVWLCLGDKKDNEIGNKGFVSIRRLGENFAKENIANQFPKGKVVTTRILAFDYMEQIYNCSLEREKLEQKYWRLDQLSVGDRVSCEVVGVDDNGLKLALGFIRLYTFKEHSADVPYHDLSQHFTIGDIVDGRVLKINRELQQGSVTLKETLIRAPALDSYEAARCGDCYWGTVRQVHDHSLHISFYNNVGGFLKLPETHQSYFPGQLVKCYITYVNTQERKLLLSFSPSQTKDPLQLTVGELYELVVTDIRADHLVVSACDYEGVEGIVPKCHLRGRNAYREGDFLKAWLYLSKSGVYHFSPNPAIKAFFKVGQNIKPRSKLTCCVANMDGKNITVYTPLPDFPVIEIPKKKWANNGDIELYQIVRVYVEHINTTGRSLVLTCTKPTSQNLIEFIDDDVSKETANGCSLNSGDNTITSSSTNAKKERNKPTKAHKNSKQKSIESDSTLNVTESRKRKYSKSEELLDTSDTTRDEEKLSKKKLKRDKEEKRSLENLLASQEVSSDVEEHVHDLSVTGTNNASKFKSLKLDGKTLQQEKRSTDKNCIKSERMKKKKNHINKTLSEDDNNAGDEEIGISQVSLKKTVKRLSTASGVNSKDNPTKKSKKLKKDLQTKNLNIVTKKDAQKLTLSETGFLWNVKLEDLNKPVEEPEEDTDEDAEDSNQGKKKKTAGERRRAAKEEEARLRAVEQTLLDSESNPQSIDQFDRAVLARPDDADLWIKYMSHHLQATEIEKARAVARRALQTINQRHEVERLNMSIALLNLEHLFGTQESLQNCMAEALRTNDEFTVYCKMLHIYSQANKSQETEQLVNTMLRKFRSSVPCWLQCCSALMKCELPDKARNMVQRAITALPPKEHVNLLCKFALLENQYGFSEQAQTLFEHVLTSYPKRTDVWNVYVDMLVKTEKVEVARQILERAARQKLPARKMKMIFSKWISFEEKHGTEEKVEYVKKQALAYVKNITSNLD